MSLEDEPDLTPADRELEAALRGLRPASAGVDAVAIAYAAGAASARRALFRWRAVAAGLALALGASIVVTAVQPRASEPTIAQAPEREPLQAVAAATYPPESVGAAAYLRLRDNVLDRGLDALTSPAPSSPVPIDTVPLADLSRRPS